MPYLPRGQDVMSTYSVPNEWFENVAIETVDDYDESYDGDDESYDAEDDEYEITEPVWPARLDALTLLASDEQKASTPALQPHTQANQLDPLSESIQQLRALHRQLRREHHPLSHVPAQIANRLVDIKAPAPRIASAQEPSPVGNCRKCGASLPLPTMGRGRPRKLCLTCSPTKNPGKNI